MIATARQSRHAAIPLWFPWLYLALITAAELITSFVSAQYGLVIHALLLIGFMLHVGVGRPGPDRNLVLALTLAPLIRLLSLTLPVRNLPAFAWYPIVAIPLTYASWRIIRLLQISRRDVGLCSGKLLPQFIIAGCGVGIGTLEYMILTPAPMVTISSWFTLASTALILMVTTGFVEELIFRGLLLSVALSVMKRGAFLYVSLLFAALHIGHRSPSNVVLVFTVGLLFAVVARWSGSILGVAVAHGLANVTLFLVLPFLAPQMPTTVAATAPNLVREILVPGATVLPPVAAPNPTAVALTPSNVPTSGPSESARRDAAAVVPTITATTAAPVVKPVPTATPTPASGEPCTNAPTIGGTYTVQPGDTLWDISLKVYGDARRFDRIYDANRDQITTPSRIRPGQELTIPPDPTKEVPTGCGVHRDS